ncbi:MAG: hypothetical protein V3U75_13165 [Methylococcaceae bacterium]
MEEITAYLPQAVKVLGIFCSGFFGNRLYQKRRNGNGHITEPAITRRECELVHDGLNTRLDEGNKRMGRIETKLDNYAKEATEALTIAREHTKNK